MPYDRTKHNFASSSSSQSTPGRKLAAITPSNSTDLAIYAKALLCLAEGNVVIVPVENADEESFTVPMAPGQVLPVQVRRVMATNTTATVVAILY